MKYCVIRKESAQKIYTKEDTDIEFIQFNTKENAENYLKYGKINGEIKNIRVFTDGACPNNGKPEAKAGIGVYFGVEDPRNVSRRIDGRQTNNRAELYAIIRAIEIVEEGVKLGKSVEIYTDSDYSLKTYTVYAPKWEKRGWKKSDGKPVKNLELVKRGYELYSRYSKKIKLTKVKAHTGATDLLSVGNDWADRLANLGAARS